MKLLVIADDFTGALDTGIQFASSGIEVYVASVYKGQHAPNRVISVIFCVILNRRTSSTPLSSALKITEIPAVGVFES